MPTRADSQRSCVCFVAMPDTNSLHGALGRLSRSHATSKLEEAGFFLGASRDFWIVLASCVAACLVSFFASFAAVELQTRRRGLRSVDDGSGSDSESASHSELLDPLLEKPAANPGFVQRVLFKADFYGGTFAFNADLALRCSVVTLFCAATYFFEWLSWWQKQGWEMSYVVVILAFSFYLDLGTTNYLAWTGFYGTLLPVVNCWFMYGMFPSGVKVDDDQWDPSWAYIFGYVNFFCVVLLTVSFNFATNAKMFALSWQAYFTMCFINPDDTTLFSRGPADVLLKGAETGALMGTVWGCVFAVFASILPTCISSLKLAQDVVLQVAWSQGRLIEQLVNLRGVNMDSQTSVVFAAEVRALHQQIMKAKASLENSWWECFGWGRAGRSSSMLVQICDAFDILNDWLEAIIMSVQHSEAVSTSQHIFDAIVPELEELVRASRLCLHLSATVAVSGRHDDDETLRAALEALDQAQARLAQRFKMHISTSPLLEAFKTDHLPELALAGSMSGYSQAIADHTRFLLETDLPPTTSLFCTCIQGVMALPPTLKDLKSDAYHRETWKVFVTFVLCFVLGRFGLGSAQKFVPNYNSTPAGTVAYLIFQGGNEAAALKKNTDRFLGVGLGTMLGQLTLGTSCAFGNFFQTTFISQLFLPVYVIVEFASFYLYFGSPSFSYVGLLVACFFAEHALAKCGDITHDSLTNYVNLLSQLLAIGIASLMDVATDASLSVRAAADLEAFIGVFHDAISCFTPGNVGNVQDFRAQGLALLSSARANGQEAGREPRLRRVPWRAELWGNVMQFCGEAWQCLTILGCTATQSSRQQVVIRKAGHVLLSSHHFVHELEALKQRAHEAFDLTMNLMRQDFAGDISPVTMDLQQQLVASNRIRVKAAPEILSDVRKRLAREQAAPSLLEDELCSVAMMLMMLEALAVRVQRLETDLLKQPEMWQLLTQEDHK